MEKWTFFLLGIIKNKVHNWVSFSLQKFSADISKVLQMEENWGTAFLLSLLFTLTAIMALNFLDNQHSSVKLMRNGMEQNQCA